MNRRGFLSLFGAAAVTAAIPLGVADELWTPSKTIFLPPIGGWARGNSFLTTDMISREALRVMHQHMRFVTSINRRYDDSFVPVGNTVRIRLPATYASATA